MKFIKYSLVCVIVLMFSFGANAGPNVTVEFENDPLFSQMDIVPGDSTTKWVRVTNHTEETQIIGVIATNTYDCSVDPYCLADVLEIEIKEGATTMYANTLAGFFIDGGVVLSNLSGNDAQTLYNVTIQFPSLVTNEYMYLSTNFDLEFGFANGGDGGIEIITAVTTGNDPPIGSISTYEDGSGVILEPQINTQEPQGTIVVPDFEYEPPNITMQGPAGPAAPGTIFIATESLEKKPNVLGFELLPVTGGEVFAYFGMGDPAIELQPKQRTQISQFLIGFIGYGLVLLIILVLRIRRKRAVE